MGEPLRAAVRLLVELPPLTNFLASIPDAEMPSHCGGQASGLELPAGCPEFWQAAAEGVLAELRSSSEHDQTESESKKARLRRFLHRAHHDRKRQPPQRGSNGGGPLWNARMQAQDLPSGVTAALPGLFLADVPQACENALAPPATLSHSLGVEDVVCFGDFASDEQRLDFWSVYSLFEQRLVLLFDQGRSALVVGPPAVLTCLLYGLLLRRWEMRAEEALDYIKHLDREAAVVPQTFRARCVEGMVHHHAHERPSVLRALWQHIRLLEESQRWPLPRSEPLTRATEALLAQALGWDPRRHDTLSLGAVCLAILRSIRAELKSLKDQSYSLTWLKLASVRWTVCSKSACEDGFSMEAGALAPKGDAEKELQTKLVEELKHALDATAKPPLMLVLTIEGQRHVLIEECVELSSSVRYHTFAVAVGSSFVTRSPGSPSLAIPGASVQGDVLSLQAPFTIVLAQMQPEQKKAWIPWSQILSSCKAPRRSGIVESTQTFKLRLATIAQYEGAEHSTRPSAWEEADAVGELLELPRDAKISTLQQKVAAKLQIPVSWQLLLAPVEQRGERTWNILMPSARVMDHAVSVSDGSLVLALSVQRDAGQWLQRGHKSCDLPASTFLTFPWMPVVCTAWIEHQPVPLDSFLFDSRCSLASYASRVAQRIEEELGPRAYCNAFAVYELVHGASPGSKASWRPLKLGAPIVTELRNTAHQSQQNASSRELPHLLWEALPLAPSMTGRGYLAAQDAACLPDHNATKRVFPLERLASRKTEQQEAGLASLYQQLTLADDLPSSLAKQEPQAGSDAEEYAALLILEERLLVAWVEDSADATTEITLEARSRIDAMVARLRILAPYEAPPGLKEWPAEPIHQWSCRIWEKICRGASSLQVWTMPGPDATEDEVMRSLLWAEVSTLQEIVLSLDAIRFARQGRVTLGSTSHERLGQVSHIGASVSDVVEAERTYYLALLNSSDLDELFSYEIEDLPSECDTDVGCLHAFIQTTNAELNSVWLQQRQQILSKNEAVLWRIVRLRELALSALFLLLKQTQATKVIDGVILEWLQQVQQGSCKIVQKSKILCEAASALAGLPGGGETTIAEAMEKLSAELAETSAELTALGGPSGEVESDSVMLKHAEEKLVVCDTRTLLGNLALLALERQLESSVTPLSSRLASCMRTVRQGLHSLTMQTMLVRSRFELPLDDASTTITLENQRRGRKMRLLGKNTRRTNAPNVAALNDATPEALADGMAAEAEAEAQAKALLKSEAQAQAKKDARKRKQNKKKSAAGRVNGDAEQPTLTSQPEAGASEKQAKTDTLEVEAEEIQSKKDAAEVYDIQVKKAVTEVSEDIKADTTSIQISSEGAKCSFSEPEEEAAPDAAPSASDEASNGGGKLDTAFLHQPQAQPMQVALNDDSEEESLPDTGFRVIKSGKAKKKTKQTQAEVKKMYTQEAGPKEPPAPVEKRHSQESSTKTKKRVAHSAVRHIEVIDSVWRLLLQGRGSADSRLSRLQLECGCSISVNREDARVKLSGEELQVERAEARLKSLRDQCEIAHIRIPGHIKWPQALARRAEGRSTGVKVTLEPAQGGFVAHVEGLASEVKCAVDMIKSELLRSPPPADAQSHWIEVAESVWKLLIRSQNTTGTASHLSRLEEQCGCTMTVDQNSPWVLINGSDSHIEQAQTLLWQLLDDCDSKSAKGKQNRKRRSKDVRLEDADHQPKEPIQRTASSKCQEAAKLQTIVTADDHHPSNFGSFTPPLPDQVQSASSTSTTPTSVKGHMLPTSPSTVGSTLGSPVADCAGACGFLADTQPFRPYSAGGVVQDMQAFRPYCGNQPAACFFTPMAMQASYPMMSPPMDAPARRGLLDNQQQDIGLPSREDEGAQSMAARLAQEFPSARIIIGAPDAQEPSAPPPKKKTEDLDSKMRQLQALLAEGRTGKQ